jgi:hypothetical protein
MPRLPALTEVSALAIGDLLYAVDVSDATDDATGSSRRVQLDRLAGFFNPSICNGRLTLESGVPISTTDQTAKTSVYFTPYGGNRIAIYDGTRWELYTFSELTLALGTLTSDKNYDVFIYDNAGTLTLELSSAWTNDTTRADALALQDGIPVKSGATTRRHLGTIRTTSTTTTEDSGGGTTTQVGGKRFLWNRYNQVPRQLEVFDATDSWSYTTGTWRVANGATAPTNCVEYVVGDAATLVEVKSLSVASLSSNSARTASGGVGLDASTPSGFYTSGYNLNTSIHALMIGRYRGYPGLGYHYLSWLEYGPDGNCSFTGEVAASTPRKTGLLAMVLA